MLLIIVLINMFFDIVANIGKWSLSNIDNSNKIIAIEASPDTFKKLVYNTNHNKKIIPKSSFRNKKKFKKKIWLSQLKLNQDEINHYPPKLSYIMI